MARRASVFIIIALTLFIALSMTVAFKAPAAYAATELTCVQSGEVVYNGYRLVDNGRFTDFAGAEETELVNPLYSALKFYWDGAETKIDAQDIAFDDNNAYAKNPGQYELAARVEYGGALRAFNIKFKISKAPLIARTLINGERQAEISEGDIYEAKVVYEGFVGNDNVYTLDAPAIISELPKMPTGSNGFLLVSSGAVSSLYDIRYAGARIIIDSNPLYTMEFTENGANTLILSGTFSPNYELEFINTGINPSNEIYAAISEKVDRFYAGSGIFEEYKRYGAFKIGLKLDGEDVNLTDPITVNMLVDEKLNGKRNLRVLHFAPDGSYETLTATANAGYLTFNTVELGEYVLIVPIEGASLTVIIGATVGVVAFLVLVAMFVTVFRRKY